MDDLAKGMIFRSVFGVIRLEERVSASDCWYVDTWNGQSFTPDMLRVEPSDLEEQLPDDWSGD